MENNHQDTKKTGARAVLAVLGKIVLTALAAVVILFAGSLVGLILMSEDLHLALTYVVGYFVPALFVPLIWLKKRKKYLKIALAIAVLCIIAAGVNFGMAKHTESIRINTSSDAYIYDVSAEDAFVFIVHEDNPVDSLTTEQLQGIYSGAITNWSEVGGENKKIKAYQCEPESVNQTMMELFMGENTLMNPPVEMGYGYLYAWEEQVSEYRNEKNAIGFCFTSYLEDAPAVKMLSVDEIAPTQENIRNGSYPIAPPESMIAEED